MSTPSVSPAVSRRTGLARLRPRHPRLVAFTALFVAYVALTLAVIHPTPVLTLDGWWRGLDLRHSIPEGYKRWISWYVALGQRGPSTLIFLPFFLWTSWRMRSARPLVMLGTALLMLNVTVGAAKYATGRLGPLRTADTHAIFAGGNIYPSGHVSNTVMLYGLMAMVALHHRRALAVLAGWLSVTVGMGTIYLNTHWFSDVVAGWLAGGLILVALPWVMPVSERVTASVVARLKRRGRAPGAVAGTVGRHRRAPAVAPGPVRHPVGAAGGR